MRHYESRRISLSWMMIELGSQTTAALVLLRLLLVLLLCLEDKHGSRVRDLRGLSNCRVVASAQGEGTLERVMDLERWLE